VPVVYKIQVLNKPQKVAIQDLTPI